MEKIDYEKFEFLEEDQIKYLETRLDDQIHWYDKKSIKYKKIYTFARIFMVTSSASIPILTKFNILIAVMILGALITVMESWLSIFKFNENWIEYRKICETLQHEKYMYLHKAGIYNEYGSDFSYFVERIESIISQENLNWASLNNTKE